MINTKRNVRIYIGLEDSEGEKYSPEQVKRLADRFLEGYTFFLGEGAWKGKREPVAVIEWAGEIPGRIFEFAKEAKRILNQESVLVTLGPVEILFV